eukprot:Selendium_serpulae@DN2711_c0_g1_i2.p1
MTEYWVSTARHHCDVCKVWISGHRRNIEDHNRSTTHIQNVQRSFSDACRRHQEKDRNDAMILAELAQIEKKSKLSAADDAKWFGGGGSQSKSVPVAKKLRTEAVDFRSAVRPPEPPKLPQVQDPSAQWVMSVDPLSGVPVYYNPMYS